MISVVEFFSNVVQEIQTHPQKPNLKPQGSKGSLAYITVEAITLANDILKHLKNVLKEVCPDNMEAIKLISTLTLAVEHHFAVMKQRYTMPTLPSVL